jgi:hypothetical protein
LLYIAFNYFTKGKKLSGRKKWLFNLK